MSALSSVAAGAASVPTAASVVRQLCVAIGIGLVVLYGVAFAGSPLAHNAAHDVRHIAATPCH